eukprot:4682284-Ditylum_brightwellii.AAC.1
MGNVSNLNLEGLIVLKESKVNKGSVNLASKFLGVRDEMSDIRIIVIIIGFKIPNGAKAELTQILFC